MGFRSIASSILAAMVLVLWGLGGRRTMLARTVTTRHDDRSVASPRFVTDDYGSALSALTN